MKKKIIIIAAIVIGFVVIGGGYSKYNSKDKTINQTSSSVVAKQTTVVKPKSSKGMLLGTQATTKTGKIYVNMGKSISGIKGMSGPELLMVLPSLSGSGNDIGSLGVAYYNSELTKESLATFYSEVVAKSKCDYVTLVNIDNPNLAITIDSAGTFSKGSLDKKPDYELSKTTEMGLLSDNNKTVEWQKV